MVEVNLFTAISVVDLEFLVRIAAVCVVILMQLLESMDSCVADSASAAMPRKLASSSTVKNLEYEFLRGPLHLVLVEDIWH